MGVTCYLILLPTHPPSWHTYTGVNQETDLPTQVAPALSGKMAVTCLNPPTNTQWTKRLTCLNRWHQHCQGRWWSPVWTPPPTHSELSDWPVLTGGTSTVREDGGHLSEPPHLHTSTNTQWTKRLTCLNRWHQRCQGRWWSPVWIPSPPQHIQWTKRLTCLNRWHQHCQWSWWSPGWTSSPPHHLCQDTQWTKGLTCLNRCHQSC